MFTQEQLNVIKYCAEECARQHSGEESVYDMLNAWDYAHIYVKPPHSVRITTNFIIKIGQLVEPVDNKNGFRKIPIFVGNAYHTVEKAPWQEVPRLLTILLESYYDGDLTADNPKSESAEDEFYYQYEMIHPFRDGNGRSGKILYNYLRRTLSAPVMPPNYWGSSNP